MINRNPLHLVNIAKNVLLRPLTVKETPPHLQVEITDFCNLDCIMCIRRDLVKSPSHMSVDNFKKIFQMVQPSTINLSGLGEPLLHPHIFDIINYCHKSGAAVNSPTNLSFPITDIDQLVTSHISQLNISIDAATPETYRKIRGRDNFHQVTENIEKTNNRKAQLGSIRPYLRFNFALQSYNIDELIPLFDLAERLRIQAIYVQWMFYDSVPGERQTLTAGLTKEKLAQTIASAGRLARRKKIQTNLHTWKRDFDILSKRISNQAENNKRGCYFPWISSYIDVAGNVMLCPKFANTREEILGNIFKTDFKKIWNSAAYQQARMAFKQKAPHHETCRHCHSLTLFDVQTVFNRLLKGRL